MELDDKSELTIKNWRSRREGEGNQASRYERVKCQFFFSAGNCGWLRGRRPKISIVSVALRAPPTVLIEEERRTIFP